MCVCVRCQLRSDQTHRLIYFHKYVRVHGVVLWLVINVVVVGPFEEEEVGIGISSDDDDDCFYYFQQ